MAIRRGREEETPGTYLDIWLKTHLFHGALWAILTTYYQLKTKEEGQNNLNGSLEDFARPCRIVI
jgi:hypothetical protein